MPCVRLPVALRIDAREGWPVAPFVAVADGTGVGFVQLYPTFTSIGAKRAWVLNDLFVVPEARRRGVRRLVFAHVGRPELVRALADFCLPLLGVASHVELLRETVARTARLLAAWQADGGVAMLGLAARRRKA